MTLVVFPEGGQQPSTSGHQCRSGGNRMASAGSSSKPEMYSRAVQTGFPHTSDSADLQQHSQQLPICICGQAAEGNCWCESLGFLKDQELCRIVLQKGCPRSRFAVLLSMHEEFCRSARGDAIINTRRRGSAHGDIRVRRPKAAPPPTLPRPRAQSVIVQNTKAANRLNEANTKRSPPVSVKPKISVDPTRKGKPDGRDKCGSKVKSEKDQQSTDKKCLERKSSSIASPSKEGISTEDGSLLDQTSYVSKAWLLFTGCEKGKKVKDLEGPKPEESCHKESHEHRSSSISVTKRLNNQAVHVEGSSEKDKKKDDKKVSRITGLSVSSKRKIQSKSESTTVPVENCNEGVNSCHQRKLDIEPVLESKACASDVEQNARKPHISDECDRTALLDSVTVSNNEAENRVSGACHIDLPDDTTKKELSNCFVSSASEYSRRNSRVKDLDHGSDLACAELNERLKDDRSLDDSLKISVQSVERVSCHDSRIGKDGSVCESRLSATHNVKIEDKTELDRMTGAKRKNCHEQDSLSLASTPSLVSTRDECNIPLEDTNNSHVTNSSMRETTEGSSCIESTLQVEDDSLLGACAIVKKDQMVSSELHPSLPEVGERISTSHSEDRTVQSDCQSSTLEAKESSFVSAVIVIESKDSRSTSEQCFPLPDAKPCQDEASEQIFQLGANMRLKADHLDVSKPHEEVNLKSKQGNLDKTKDDKLVKKDDVIVKTKVCKKSEKERTTERKHQRIMNPRKVGMLKYLICQSPLILSELNDSDFEDSDSESEDLSYNQEDRFATLPVEIVLKIFRELPTRDLAQLKCTCKNFAWLIKRYNIVGIDSKWVEIESYRNDPCMQCGKVRDRRGDVSLCYWHPKYYYGTGTGRHHWTCCLNTNKDAPGCLESLHDNNWTTSKVMKRSIPRQWSCNMWHLCPHKDV